MGVSLLKIKILKRVPAFPLHLLLVLHSFTFLINITLNRVWKMSFKNLTRGFCSYAANIDQVKYMNINETKDTWYPRVQNRLTAVLLFFFLRNKWQVLGKQVNLTMTLSPDLGFCCPVSPNILKISIQLGWLISHFLDFCTRWSSGHHQGQERAQHLPVRAGSLQARRLLHPAMGGNQRKNSCAPKLSSQANREALLYLFFFSSTFTF
jgi:hypothetical protein